MTSNMDTVCPEQSGTESLVCFPYNKKKLHKTFQFFPDTRYI